MDATQAKQSARDRLDYAKEYLQETMLCDPVPTVGEFTHAKLAKRRAAWDSYFRAQSALRKLS